MDLYVSKEYYGDGVPITFPATRANVLDQLAALGVYDIDNRQTVFIRGDGLAYHFAELLRPADLGTEIGIQKLNQLSEIVDSMSEAEQNVCVGALKSESIVNGLDDILTIAASLSQYEFIEGVTCDKELGGWLVEHGLAGVDFPKETWPYLDYPGIGAAYYADHGGAYTANGYVKRREPGQTQKEEEKAAFTLTLVSPTASCRIGLPASDERLEAAKRALRLDSLENAVIGDVETSLNIRSSLELNLRPFQSIEMPGAFAPGISFTG